MLVETFAKVYYQFDFDIKVYVDLNKLYTIRIFVTNNNAHWNEQNNEKFAELNDLTKEKKDKIISKIDILLRNYLKTKRTLYSEISDNSAVHQGLTSRPSCGCCGSVVCKYIKDTRIKSVDSCCSCCGTVYYSHSMNDEVEDTLCQFCKT